MSLITDLLSKVSQTKPRKDVPPGLTNSINTYKQKETNRKRAVFFSIVISVSLASGFATIYAARLLLGTPAGEARVEHAPPEPAEVLTAKAPGTRSVKAPTAPLVPAEKARAPVAPPALKKASSAFKKASSAPAAQKNMPAEPAQPLSSEGDDALRHYYMALDFEKEGNLIKAIEHYTEALALEPQNFRLMNKVAGLYIRMGMREEALGYLENCIDENADYVPALINMGIALAGMDRFEDAEKSLNRALTLEPANRLALFNAALLYEKQGMNEEALENYMKLKQLGDPRGATGIEQMGEKTPAQN